MQIEINVQDCFWDAGSPATNSNCSPSTADEQISLQTWETWFHIWLETLSPELPPAQSCELTLRLTNDPEIQTLNAQYRHQNQPTDVLAFAALEVDCPHPDEMLSSTPLYLGDIVISVETACRQAEQQGHSLNTELAWLAVHGFLHLLGWDHPDEDSLTQMLARQEILLQAVGIAVKATSML